MVVAALALLLHTMEDCNFILCVVEAKTTVP